MFKIFLLAVLFSTSLFLHGCKTADADSISLKTPEKFQNNGIVNFKGVSFRYNQKIFGEVRAEEIADYFLQGETDKPDFVAPKHRLFTFDLATDYSPMEIAVYPINDFPRMYAVNKSSVEMMEKEIEGFKKVLKDKNFRADRQIPYLPFRDAGQAFQIKVKHFPFSGGKGILFLTFWRTQFELPSNRQLRYVFEGLTDDGKYYVFAEMPARVDFLSDESADEYEGYKVPWGKFDDEAEMERFAGVYRKIADRLEKLPKEEFQPHLTHFEELISSLKIEE